MNRVLFLGVPAHGHTNPSLPLVEELINRGSTVKYYSFPEFKDKIEKTGAEYSEYKNFPALKNGSELVKNFVVLVNALIKTTSVIIDSLIIDIKEFKPDYIIHDSICLWGNYAAKVCSIPTITSITTFIFTEKTTTFMDKIKFIFNLTKCDKVLLKSSSKLNKEITNSLGINHNNFLSCMMNLSPLNICYTLKELQPKYDMLNKSQFKFVGPSINKNIQDENEFDFKSFNKPIIYISLGTIHIDEEFLINCAKSLHHFNCTAIFSINSEEIKSKIKKINPNYIVRKRVNQINVLKNADLFISHGGMNSVHESLNFGVPLCIYPFHKEQETVATVVVNSHCGTIIKNSKKRTIYKAISKVIRKKEYKDNSLYLSKQLVEAGGCITAVDEIYSYLKTLRN